MKTDNLLLYFIMFGIISSLVKLTSLNCTKHLPSNTWKALIPLYQVLSKADSTWPPVKFCFQIPCSVWSSSSTCLSHFFTYSMHFAGEQSSTSPCRMDGSVSNIPYLTQSLNSFFQDLPMITEMLDAVDQKENGKEEV